MWLIIVTLAVSAMLVTIGCTQSVSPTSTAILTATVKPMWTPTATTKPLPTVTTQLNLRVGEIAPDFTLKDLKGMEITLSQLLADKPVVIEFGSYT